MIWKVYSVYDVKTEAYLQPFFLQSKGQAIRVFSDLISNKDHAFAKHPEDYTLFELGSFNDNIAKFDLYSAAVPLGVALEFVKV